MALTAEQKVLAFEYCILNLIEKSIGENTPNPIDLSTKKLKFFPFLLATANGEKSRQIMFDNIFTSFKPDKENDGLIETEIEEKSSIYKKFEFFYGGKYMLEKQNINLSDVKAKIDRQVSTKEIQKWKELVDAFNIDDAYNTLSEVLEYSVDKLISAQKNILKKPANKISTAIENQISYKYIVGLTKSDESIDAKEISESAREFYLKESSYFSINNSSTAEVVY